MDRALLRSLSGLRAPLRASVLGLTFKPTGVRRLNHTAPRVEPAQQPEPVAALHGFRDQNRDSKKAPAPASRVPSSRDGLGVSTSATSATSATSTTSTTTAAPIIPAAPTASTHAHAQAPPTEVDPSIHELLPLLASQPGHYVTVHIHGRPYLVTRGDQVRLPFLMPGVQPGDVLRLNRASVVGSRDYTLKGAPYVDERLYECRAVVLGTEPEPMRVLIKKKPRTRRKKHVKSKHRYTLLRISELKISQLGDLDG